MAEITELRGATIKDVEFDLVNIGMTLLLDVLDRETTTSYRLVINGMSRAEFVNSVPAPWAYAELSRIFVEPQGDDQLVEMELWLGEAEVKIAARSVLVSPPR